MSAARLIGAPLALRAIPPRDTRARRAKPRPEGHVFERGSRPHPLRLPAYTGLCERIVAVRAHRTQCDAFALGELPQVVALRKRGNQPRLRLRRSEGDSEKFGAHRWPVNRADDDEYVIRPFALRMLLKQVLEQEG